MNHHPTPPIWNNHDDMHYRRKLMLLCGLSPLLSSCATDFSQYKNTSPTNLARQLGICSTSYATFKHGQMDQIQTVSGCTNKHPLSTDAIFQAASLTKPVTAYVALQWFLEGKLDLSKPVSHYLPKGYTHFHKILARTVNDPHDVIPPSALAHSLVWHEQHHSEVHSDAIPGLWAPRPGKFKHALAAASLYTTALDYSKFLCAVLRQEKLLALTLSSPVMVDRSLGIEWGYGWGIERSNSGPHLWHWGNNPGFRSFAMFSPMSGNGFVAFTNHHQGIAMAARIAQDVLPGEHQAFNFHMVS